MTVNQAYSIIQYIVNKNQDGYLTEDEFNLIINQAQEGFLDYLLGQTQQYQPGRPVPRVALGNNQTVRQQLTPLIYGYNLHIDSVGFAPYPSDYVQRDAMWSLYGYQAYRYAEQSNLHNFIGSSIDPIASNPIYLIEELGFRFHPNQTDEGSSIPYNTAKLSYVRKPPSIYWGSTPSIYGMPMYNPATSVDPVWRSVDMLEVISRALKFVGINMQAQQVETFAQDIIKNGQ